MPDTPIDQSEHIPSVRLKVPTAEVPIPPEGFAQLHSPAPGELALRLPDGSVVAVGGGGGGGGDTITGDGGSVSTDATPGHDPGVVLSPALGKTIWFNGPVVGPGENQPFGMQVSTVEITSAQLLTLDTVPKVLVPAPGAGRYLWPLGFFLVATTTTAMLDDETFVGFLSATIAGGATFLSTNPANVGLGDAGTWVTPQPANNAPGRDAAVYGNAPLLLSLDTPLDGGEGTLLVATAYLVV